MIDFGKHKDMTVRNLRMGFPNYVHWMINTARENLEAQPARRAVATYLIIKKALDGENPTTAEDTPVEDEVDEYEAERDEMRWMADMEASPYPEGWDSDI